jgi:hypothetical protein
MQGENYEKIRNRGFDSAMRRFHLGAGTTDHHDD